MLWAAGALLLARLGNGEGEVTRYQSGGEVAAGTERTVHQEDRLRPGEHQRRDPEIGDRVVRERFGSLGRGIFVGVGEGGGMGRRFILRAGGAYAALIMSPES